MFSDFTVLSINYGFKKLKGKAQKSVEKGREWMGGSRDRRPPPAQMHCNNYLLVSQTVL